MAQRTNEVPVLFRPARIASIELHPEFRYLGPNPAPDERGSLVRDALEAGVTAPLVVWKWQNRLILLVGYHVIAEVKDRGLSHLVIVKHFVNRAQARQFILDHYLRHGIITRLALSYMRGVRCLGDKPGRGGDRKSPKFRASSPATASEENASLPRPSLGPRRTIAALAESQQVSARTLHLDKEFADAVDRFVAAKSPDGKHDLTDDQRQRIRWLLLRHGSGATRQRIMTWSAKPPEAQLEGLRALLATGKLPRLRRQRSARRSITLPLEPESFVQTLRRRESEELFQTIATIMQKERTLPPPAARGWKTGTAG